MANFSSPSERAIQILAEIEREEKLKKEGSSSPQSLNANENQYDLSTEGKTIEIAKVTKQTTTKSVPKTEPNYINFSNFNQNDIIKGVVFSELLNKPLALRRYRRF